MMVRAALAYARRLSWAVFPVQGKQPAIPRREGGRGYHDATTDPEMIQAYWARYLHANIGINCIGSGIVALDVDPRHGGNETLAEFEGRYGPLPNTVRATTGGGEHILFSRRAMYICAARSVPAST